MQSLNKSFIFFALFICCFVTQVFATTVHVYLVGTGLVGNTLLKQIENYNSPTHDIRIVGLANSRQMCFNMNGHQLNDWRASLDKGETMSIDAFMERMSELNLPHSVFVDCTSNQNIAEAYASILESGISIVTPNKKANSSHYAYYQALKEICGRKHVHFYYDANVGAGLPIVSTIQNLMASGDRIIEIQAILSGTLSYLFNNFSGKKPFSEIVREAQSKGYTEPDPRDDLNGMDFARKMLILSRETGLSLEMEDIFVQKFLPLECFAASSVDEFYANMKAYDPILTGMRQGVASEGKTFRYIGNLQKSKVHISLQAVGSEHPFYHLKGTDNIISIKTERYRENPIVIQGPGAGAEVTAGGVLGGILRTVK